MNMSLNIFASSQIIIRRRMMNRVFYKNAPIKLTHDILARLKLTNA